MKPIESNSNFAKIGMLVAADVTFFVYSAVKDHVPHGSEMDFRLHDSSPTESYFQHGRAPEKIHPFDLFFNKRIPGEYEIGGCTGDEGPSETQN